jgi:predicted ester cyclase
MATSTRKEIIESRFETELVIDETERLLLTRLFAERPTSALIDIGYTADEANLIRSFIPLVNTPTPA